jgi:hypothetical protein
MSDKDILSKYLGARSKNSSNLLGTYISMLPQVSQKDRELAPISAGFHDVISTLMKAKLYKRFEEQRELAEQLEAQKEAKKEAEKAADKAFNNALKLESLKVKQEGLALKKALQELKAQRNKNSGPQYKAVHTYIKSLDPEKQLGEARKYEALYPGITEKVKIDLIKSNVDPQDVIEFSLDPEADLRKRPQSLFSKIATWRGINKITGEKPPKLIIAKKPAKEEQSAIDEKVSGKKAADENERSETLKNRLKDRLEDIKAFGPGQGELLLGQRLGQDALEASKDPIGALATFGSEAAFDVPQFIKPVKEKIQKFKKEHPQAAKDLSIAGFGASLPVGSGVVKGAGKALSKVISPLAAKGFTAGLSKTNPGARVLRAFPENAFLGSLYQIGGKAKDLNDVKSSDVLKAALVGAGLGGGIGVGATLGLNALKRGLVKGGASTRLREAAKSVEASLPEVEAARDLLPESSKYLANPLTLADTKTQALGNKLYLENLDSRAAINELKKGLGVKQLDLLDSAFNIFGKPIPTKEVAKELSKIARNKKAAPFYELVEKGADFTEKEMPQIFKDIEDINATAKRILNLNDKTKYRLLSRKIVSELEKNYRDRAAAAFKAGKTNEGIKLTTIAETVDDFLKKSDPNFARAKLIEREGFKFEEAVEQGYKDIFDRKVSLAKMKENYNKLGSAEERMGYREGAIDATRADVQSRAASAEIPKDALKLANPVVREKVEFLLGKEKAKEFFKRIDPVNKMIDNIRHYSAGSATTERFSDVSGSDISRGIKSPNRGFWKWLGDTFNKYGGMVKGAENEWLTDILINKPQEVRKLSKGIKAYDAYSPLGKLTYRNIPNLATRLMSRTSSDD